MSADFEDADETTEYEDCPLCGEPNEKGFMCRYVRAWRANGARPDFIKKLLEVDEDCPDGGEEKERQEETSSAPMGTPDQSEAGTEAREEKVSALARQPLHAPMLSIYLK